MVNPMFLLLHGAENDEAFSRLLPRGPDHAIAEMPFQLYWGDSDSIRQQQTFSGFRLDLIARPSGQEDAALIVWEGLDHSLTVARPWPGRPSVYVSKDGRAVSSHLRFLVQTGQAVRPMPTLLAPGARRRILPEGAMRDANEAEPPAPHEPFASTDHAAQEVRSALYRAVGALPADAVLLLSGGIDSAAIAAAAPNRLRCMTWTTAKAARSTAEDSDLSAARCVAEHLGVPHEVLDLTADQLQANVDLAVLLGEVRRGTLVDDLVVYVEVARALRRQGVKTVVIGEAADDAFGCLPSNLRFFQGEELLDKLRRDYELGMTADYAAISKVFGAFGIDVIDPYLSVPVAEVSRRLPLEMRVDAERLMKPVLRQAFREELPDSVVRRPKRVSRDVSGVRVLMQERFGASRERFLAVFDALFRDRAAPARQHEILARVS
jgi:asparagine synthetase B (glutamine-hydrolysing)